MNADVTEVLAALKRVQTFIDKHAAALDNLAACGTRHELDAAVTALEQHSVGQAAAERMGLAATVTIRVARNKLRLNHMAPIANLAAAHLRDVPELGALKMPDGKIPSLQLVAVAGAMGKAAAPYAKTFIDAGLRTDFLDRLDRAANALVGTIDNRDALIGAGTGATRGLKEAASIGRKQLSAISSMIVPLISDAPALYAEWRAMKRIGSRRGQKRPRVEAVASPVVDTVRVTEQDGATEDSVVRTATTDTGSQAKALVPPPAILSIVNARSLLDRILAETRVHRSA
ncbi:MAG: hypothetical protein ABI442_20765 [Gemmatimonadaceae bacterium]